MSNCQAILNHVVFKFVDTVHNGQFTNEKIGSILLANKGKDHQEDSKYSRIAIVTHIGSQVKDVVVGDKIVVDKLCWTPGFKVGEETFWRTTEDHILGIVDSE